VQIPTVPGWLSHTDDSIPALGIKCTKVDPQTVDDNSFDLARAFNVVRRLALPELP
jgi:hypothetical protein